MIDSAPDAAAMRAEPKRVQARLRRMTGSLEVTRFTAGPAVQTLPLWIFGNLFRPNQAPVVNVVAAVLIVAAVVPVWIAQRVADEAGTSRF